jgi:hypothetical protein
MIIFFKIVPGEDVNIYVIYVSSEILFTTLLIF